MSRRQEIIDAGLTRRQREATVRSLNEAHSQVDRLGNRGKWEPSAEGHQSQRETLGGLEKRIKRLGG